MAHLSVCAQALEPAPTVRSAVGTLHINLTHLHNIVLMERPVTSLQPIPVSSQKLLSRHYRANADKPLMSFCSWSSSQGWVRPRHNCFP
jgi:hypothetical protein